VVGRDQWIHHLSKTTGEFTAGLTESWERDEESDVDEECEGQNYTIRTKKKLQLWLISLSDPLRGHCLMESGLFDLRYCPERFLLL